MTDVPRLLFVHAHPDDETINNGATIAHYAAAGAEVTVLTCTLGEEGEIIGEELAGLGVDAADQLGGYRIGELAAALHRLGAGPPRFLGGAGRWRDSGMAGTPARRRTRFIDADIGEVTAEVVEVIAELRPHVVVTYDPQGGYGHPDHIRAHQVTANAVDAAAPHWRVPKFYWTVLSSNAFRLAMDGLGPDDVKPDWIRLDELPFGYPDDRITAVVDAPVRLAEKAGALSAHATQVEMGPTGRAFALSNKLIAPIMAQEHYVLAAGRPGVVDESGWEHDLLAGLGMR